VSDGERNHKENIMRIYSRRHALPESRLLFDEMNITSTDS
jgi:hypothetical protein